MTLRTLFLTAFLLLTTPAILFSAPIVYGESWDGTPPGTLVDVMDMGNVFETNTAPFTAGTYEITFGGCISAWCNEHTLRAGSTTLLSNGRPETLRFTMDSAFEIFAFTPSLITGSGTGSGQWAFYEQTPGVWVWGLEDIDNAHGDNDFQDLFGTLRMSDLTPIPTPEPSSLLLLGSGIGFIANKIRKRRKTLGVQ